MEKHNGKGKRGKFQEREPKIGDDEEEEQDQDQEEESEENGEESDNDDDRQPKLSGDEESVPPVKDYQRSLLGTPKNSKVIKEKYRPPSLSPSSSSYSSSSFSSPSLSSCSSPSSLSSSSSASTSMKTSKKGESPLVKTSRRDESSSSVKLPREDDSTLLKNVIHPSFSSPLPSSVKRQKSKSGPSGKEKEQKEALEFSEKQRQFMNNFRFYIKIALLVCIVGVFLVILKNPQSVLEPCNDLYMFFMGGTVPTFTPLPLITHFPVNGRCYNVNQNEIQEYGKGKDEEWTRVLDSMRFYMKEYQLDGISAFHVGNPNCFTMIRLADSKHTILSLFNLNFRGYLADNFITRDEQSLACPTIKRNVRRANVIRVTYNEIDQGGVVVERFNGTEAWALQAVGLYSIGKTICETTADKTDYGVETLISEVNRL